MRKLIYIMPLAMCFAFAQDEKAHHASMEAAGAAMKEIQGGVKAGDGAAVAKAAAKINAAFLDVEKFWTAKASEVGIKSSKESLAASKVLAETAATSSAEDLMGKVKVLGGSCRTCHTQHRDKNAEGKYIFKY